MTEALVLGGASWNRILHLDALPAAAPGSLAARESYETAGSTGLGKALALTALGHETLLHATIGDDPDGARIRAFCTSRGLAPLFDIHPAATAAHVNLMDAEGRRLSIFAEPGDPAPPVDTARLAPLIAGARAVFVGITPSTLPLLPAIREAQGEVLVDLHDWDGKNDWHRPFLARADVVQLSDENLSQPDATMRALATGGARIVVLTRGARGALILRDGAVTEIPPAPARMVDTNGAGDVFSAALWSAMGQGAPLSEAGAFAASAAALAVESRELVPETLSHAAVRARQIAQLAPGA